MTTTEGSGYHTGTLMAGKRGLILGVANNRSIAWGIAKACRAQGAEIALTYQGDALKKRVVPLAEELGSDIVLPCDVTDTASVDAVFDELATKWGRLDCIFNNAGGPAPVGGIETIPVEGFDAAMATLVRSVMLGM
ncbi:MAG: SDR family oxidoreductase, partial [Hyphomicrobiaceae bacterium]|nr:SDR family oxidoreductase [Hyphomicrobiaceae bacterium]